MCFKPAATLTHLIFKLRRTRQGPDASLCRRLATATRPKVSRLRPPSRPSRARVIIPAALGVAKAAPHRRTPIKHHSRCPHQTAAHRGSSLGGGPRQWKAHPAACRASPPSTPALLTRRTPPSPHDSARRAGPARALRRGSARRGGIDARRIPDRGIRGLARRRVGGAGSLLP
jgi:hypothetical protein